MSACKLLAAAAILAVLSAPVMAQQVISEPGYCAFFYPNANCQNKGPGNPYTGGYYNGTGGYYTGGYQGNFADQGMAPGGQTVGVAHAKPRAHRTVRRPQ
jgi:opacity protein-like surface antigen